jgi:hypothetical protein
VVQAFFIFIQPLLIRTFGFKKSTIREVIGVLFTNIVVHFSLIFFRAESLDHAWGLINKILGSVQGKAPVFLSPGTDTVERALVIALFASPVLIVHALQAGKRGHYFLQKSSGLMRFAGFVSMILMTVLVYFFQTEIRVGEEFIYFQF